MTHYGFLKGSDARTQANYKQKVKLRETKNFWVDEYGNKYRKSNGRKTNSKWAMYYLDVESIVRLGGIK